MYKFVSMLTLQKRMKFHINTLKYKQYYDTLSTVVYWIWFILTFDLYDKLWDDSFLYSFSTYLRA